MPIDFNLILARLLPAFKPAWQKIVDAMESIGKDLGDKFDAASAMERATRDYPILTFQYDAVVTQIAAHQKGMLGREPAGPFLPASIRQEWLLPGLMSRLHDAVHAIRDAVARFRVPRPDMFSGQGSRFTDVFGQMGLLVRAFVQDYRPVRFLEATAGRAVAAFHHISPPGPAQPASEGQATGAAPAPGDTLSQIPLYLAGALLLVPAFFGWLDSLALVAGLAIRIAVLDEMEKLQTEVFALRAEILTGFLEILRSNAQKILEFLFAVEHILLRTLTWYGTFITVFFLMLGKKIQGIVNIIRKVIGVALKIANMIGSAMNWIRGIPIAPGINVGDILDLIQATPGLVMDQLDLAERASRGDPRTHALITILRAIARLGLPVPPRLARPVLPPFPDIYATILGPQRGRLLGLLNGLRVAVVPGVEQMLAGASGFLNGTADAFTATELTAARAGSPAIWNAVRDSADRITHTAFGARPGERDPLAAAFDQQVLTAGMGTIQAAIPRYIGGVVNWWRERRRTASTPTSPHMLARRARLSRVRMPRLAFRATGYDVADATSRGRLLEQLQQRMKERVEQAWRSGELEAARG